MNKKEKKYDLEERTERFAANCRAFIKELVTTIGNREDSKQLIRSSGSVAANYIEANEAFSKKDFVFRSKICRKEVKESRLWLSLCYISQNQSELENQRNFLIVEAIEITKIFGAIVESCK